MDLESNNIGMLSTLEGAMIQFLSSQCKEGCIVQIGCFKGRSTDYIIKGKTTKAYLIDIEMLPEMNKFQSEDTILVTGDSHNINTLNTVTEPIEFLFIDGGHKFEDTKQDIILWYPKILSGGMIMIHDVYDINGFISDPEVNTGVFAGLMHKYNELKFDNFIFNPFHRLDTSVICQKL